MGKALTKLQRLGISWLLKEHAINVVDGRQLYEGGTITFVHNEHGKWYNMYVNVKQKITFQNGQIMYRSKELMVMTLEETENIDTHIRYNYEYDHINNMFHITEIEQWFM